MNDSNNARSTGNSVSGVAVGMALGLGLIAATTMLPTQARAQYPGGDYSQQGAPIERQTVDGGQPGYGNGEYDSTPLDQQQAEEVYQSDLTDAASSIAPPPLPYYEQPPAPDENYLWTPGYWAWGPGGYYWVPGSWVEAPYEGALWTPGYWDFFSGSYRFHHGYWGLHVGYYGGIDYGYGYVGHGYYGGYWNHNHFFYNTTINHVDVGRVHSVFYQPVRVNNILITGRIGNRTSYNGGRGGVFARPLESEVRVLHEQRIPPMAAQERFRQAASQNRQQFYNVNRGRPMSAVSAGPVGRDHELPAALPRGGGSFGQPGGRGEGRPGDMHPGPMQEGRPQPQYQQQPGSYPARSGEQRSVEPQGRPGQQSQPEGRPSQPQSYGQQSQPQPQSQGRFGQQPQSTQPQPQNRYGQQPQSTQPQSTQPQGRFGQQSQPQSTQPQSQGRFGQQPQSTQPQSQPQQSRPQSTSQPQTAPATAHPQTKAAPAAHPQSQTRPAQAVQSQDAPKKDDKQH